MRNRKFGVVLVAVFSVMLVAGISHGMEGFIGLRDGYFYDKATDEAWVPHGIAYQSWNRPLGVWQTPEQIEYDLDEIVKMGGNSVRIDMVWQHIEGDGATSVAEGDNNFDWGKYDYFVAECEKRDLRIFALIGYQWPPNWFPDEWYTMHPPEWDAEGIYHDERWQSDIINYEHPEARKQYAEWLGAVAGHFKDSKAIVGWIVGNESGYLGLWSGLLDGYDPESEQAFRVWCQAKYGTIAAVNDSWGTSFADFDSITFVEQYRAYGADGAEWADMVQWREDSIATFTAIGAVGAKQADTNHLISYSTVGMQWGEEDWRYHAEDRGKITAECIASNAPIDFFSVNNYPWSVLGHESQNGQWGISYTKKVAKVPVLYSETGFTSSETMWPGMNEFRQGPLVRNALWESLEAGAIGTHIFSWMDRPYITDREKGFGIVYADRRVKPALWTSKEAYNLMEQVDIHNLLMDSDDPTPDIAFLWTDANDSQYNRYECEMQQIAGALERLGYEPYFIDLQDLAAGDYVNYEVIILPRNMRVEDEVPGSGKGVLTFLLEDVIGAGVHVMATADLPGMQNFNGKARSGFEQELDDLFGIDVSDVGGFEAPMRRREYVSWYWRLIEVDFNANSPIDGYHCWPQVWKMSDEIEVTDGTLWATMDSGRNKGYEDSDTEVVKWDGYWGNVTVRTDWGWAYEGDNMVQMWGDSGMWKDDPVVPFGRYTFSAYLRSNSSDPLAGGSEAVVAIEWRNQADQVISTSESTHLTTATPGDGWVEFKVDAMAPADAWTARRIIRTQGSGSGSVYVDQESRNPAVVVKDHGTAKAGIFLFSAGDQRPDSDLDGDPDVYAWKWRYDYFGAMVRDYFGVAPQVTVSGENAYLCLPEHRTCSDGTTLWQIKNYMYDPNYPASAIDPIGGGASQVFTVSSPLFVGKTIKAFYQSKIIEEDCDGTIHLTLSPDGMEMLHVYDSTGADGQYEVGSSDGRMWGMNNGRSSSTVEGPDSFPLASVYTSYYSYARGPIVAGDRLFAVENYFSHMIGCYDVKTGSNLWHHISTNGVNDSYFPRSMAVADNLLFAVTKNNAGTNYPVGALYAFDVATGELQWSFDNPGTSYNASAPVIKDGVVFTAFIADEVRAIYADTGVQKWASTNGAGASAFAGLALGNGKVYEIRSGYLYAFDEETGASIFKTYVNRPWYAEASPVVVGDKVYVARNHMSTGVGVYDANDGSLLWNYPAITLDKFATPAVGEGIMAVVGVPTNTPGVAKVLAYDATQAGVALWEYVLPVATYDNVTPIIANGFVYINADDLYVLDASTGALVYTKEHGGSSYEPFVKNNWVFVPHSNGRIEALSDGTPWPVPVSSGNELVTIKDTPAVVHPLGDKSYLCKIGYDCRDRSDLTLKLAFCERGDNGDGSTDEVYEQLDAMVGGSGSHEFWLWVPDADQNDSDYVSTTDGGSYQFRAWLEDGEGQVVTEAVAVPTELEWGVRPTTPLPTELVKGSQVEIGIEWEDLYEYLPWEVTPLTRNDAFPNRIALFRSTKTEAQFPGQLDRANEVADWLESLGYQNGNPLDISFDNVEVIGEGALVQVSAWSADAQQGSGSWGNSGWENRNFRVLLEGSSITRDGDVCYLTLKGRTSGNYNARRVSLVLRDGTTLNGVDSSFAQVTFGGSWNDGAVVPAGGTVTSDPIAFDVAAGQDVFMTYWGDAGLPTVYRSGSSGNTHTWTITGADHTSTIDWGALTINGGANAHVYAALSLDVMGIGEGPTDVDFNAYTIQSYAASQDAHSTQYELLDDGATLHMWGNNWKCISLPYTVTADTVIEFDFMADGAQGEINGIGFDTDLNLSANRLFQLWGTQTWGLSPYRNYTGSGWTHYSIPVGQNYVGSHLYMMFANDADAGQATSCYFKNVQIHEGSVSSGAMLASDFSSTMNDWTRAAGAANWEIDNEALRASRIGNSDNIMVAGSASWSNYTLSADIRYNEQGPYFNDAEVYVRYQDRDNFVKVGLRNFYGFWRLKYTVREDAAIVDQGWIHEFSKAERPEVGVWYNLQVDVDEDSFVVSFDGEEVGTFAAGNLSSGKVGLGSMAAQLGIWEPQQGYYFVDDDEYSFWAPEGESQLEGHPLNLDWGYLDAFYPTLILPSTYVMSDVEVENIHTWINGGLRCLIATDGGVAIKDETGADDPGRIEDLFGVDSSITTLAGLTATTLGNDGHYVTLDHNAGDQLAASGTAVAWTDVSEGTALGTIGNGTQTLPALIVNSIVTDPVAPKKVFCFNFGIDVANQLEGDYCQLAARALQWAQGEAYKVRLELKYPSPLGDVNVDLSLLTVEGWLLTGSGTNTLIVDIPDDGIMTGDDLYWVMYVYSWDAEDPWIAHGGFYSSENDSDGGVRAGIDGQGLQILGISESAFGGREWDTWVAYNTRGEELDMTFGVKEKGSLTDEDAFADAGFAGWTITPSANIAWSVPSSDVLRADVVGSGGYAYITRDGLDLNEKNITVEYDVYFSSAATNGGIVYRGRVLYLNPAMAGWDDGSMQSYDSTGLSVGEWHRVAVSVRDGDPYPMTDVYVDGQPVFLSEPIENTNWTSSTAGFLSPYYGGYSEWDNVRFVDEEYSFVTLESLTGEYVPTNANQASFYTWVPDYDPLWWEFCGTEVGGAYEWFVYFRGADLHSRSDVNIYFAPRLMAEDASFPVSMDAGDTVQVPVEWEQLGTNLPAKLAVALQHVGSKATYGETIVDVTVGTGQQSVSVDVSADAPNGEYMWVAYMYPPTAADPYLERLGFDDTYRSDSTGAPIGPETAVSVSGVGGVFTVYSDDGLALGGDLYKWPYLANVDANHTILPPPEGTESCYALSLTSYIGWGVFNTSGTYDMSSFDGGDLKFWLWSFETLKVEIEGPAGTKSAVNVPSTGGVWQEITIPLSNFGSVDLAQIYGLFMITSYDGAEYLVDDIRWVQAEQEEAGLPINFNTYPVIRYDTSQDASLTQYEILDGGDTLHMWGNNWKGVDLASYTVTANTMLEFDFMSDGAEGEINGVGLDTDLRITSGYCFKVHGTQSWGLSNHDTYSSGSGWIHYSIPIGQHYTGNRRYLFFVNDADGGQATSVYYKNARLVEQ